MLMSIKQRKTKLEPRIKSNHNICMVINLSTIDPQSIYTRMEYIVVVLLLRRTYNGKDFFCIFLKQFIKCT